MERGDGSVQESTINKPHLRERVFIVAYPNSSGRIHRQSQEFAAEGRLDAQCESVASGSDVLNTDDDGCASSEISRGTPSGSDSIQKGEVTASEPPRPDNERVDVADAHFLRMERERSEQQAAGTSGEGETMADAEYQSDETERGECAIAQKESLGGGDVRRGSEDNVERKESVREAGEDTNNVSNSEYPGLEGYWKNGSYCFADKQSGIFDAAYRKIRNGETTNSYCGDVETHRKPGVRKEVYQAGKDLVGKAYYFNRETQWNAETESGIRRVVDGIQRGMDSYLWRERIKALGNAVVPQCAQVVGEAIKAKMRH